MDDRDLSFVDAVNPRPRRLSQDQLTFYNRHGYLKPFTAYDDAGAIRQREYFDELARRIQQARPGADGYAINGYQARCAGIYDIVTNPVIIDHVADLVGPNVIAWGTHYFSKQPHDPRKVAWHQDASYWPLTPARTVTVWLAIDDADRNNAAMKFLPGTHRQGHLKWHQATGPAVLEQEIANPEQYGEPVYDELRAGQFSMHADMLAHGSDPNPSDRRRCGLTIRYCPPTVVPIDVTWGRNAILCRGTADGTPWGFPPRPEGDDVATKVKAIGGN